MYVYIYVYIHNNPKQEISRGNVAAAISQSVQVVSTSMLMASSLSKTWELATFFAWLASGTVVRMLFRSVCVCN